MKEIDIILKNIKNKELLPVYFFQGDEVFYIDLAVKHFEQGARYNSLIGAEQIIISNGLHHIFADYKDGKYQFLNAKV